LELQTQRTGRLLRFLVLEQGAPDVRIPHDRHSGKFRDRLLQKLQPLRAEQRGHGAEPRDIPAGPRQAGDKACPDRIGARSHDDRNRPRLSLDGGDRVIRAGHDHVHLQAHQLGSGLGDPLGPAFAEPPFHDDVSSFHVPVLSQALPERLED
jgi:hypothetical protein